MMIVGWSLALLSVLPAFSGGEPENAVSTTLSAIRATPESYKGVWVSFNAQFASVGRVHNPFFTRFVESDFANFNVWADEQEIWKREQYDNQFMLLFLSKDNESLQDMVRLHRYDRIRLTGVVRNTFQGRPWIEITGYEPLEGRIDTATLTHMFRGEQHMKRRAWLPAVSELSLAPVEGVPPHVRAAVHRDLGICYLRMGESSNALSHFSQANTLVDGEDRETARLLEVAANDPLAGLDRGIDQQSVKDFERPFWEAFAPPGQAAGARPQGR